MLKFKCSKWKQPIPSPRCRAPLPKGEVKKRHPRQSSAWPVDPALNAGTRLFAVTKHYKANVSTTFGGPPPSPLRSDTSPTSEGGIICVKVIIWARFLLMFIDELF